MPHPVAIVFGLGNPGPEYAGTRHNLGFDVVERVAAQAGVRFAPCRGFVAHTCEVPAAAGGSALLVKPTSYVNRAGPVLAELCAAHGLGTNSVLVVVDDLALPAGRLRLRAGGSDGGHNGLRSIAGALGTEAYPRLRIGIGREDARAAPEFVLAGFSEEEAPVMAGAVERAADAVETWLSAGLDAAMRLAHAAPDLDPPPNGA